MLDRKGFYFLDNSKNHDNLKELNELNTEIFINNKKYKYTKSFKSEKEGLYEIKIKFKIKLKDCSYMFHRCYNLTNKIYLILILKMLLICLNIVKI